MANNKNYESYQSNALKIIFNENTHNPIDKMIGFMKKTPDHHYWSWFKDLDRRSSNKFFVHFRSPQFLEEYIFNSIQLGKMNVKVERASYLMEEEYSGVKMNLPRILRIFPNIYRPIAAKRIESYFEGVNFLIGGAGEKKTFLYFKNNEDMLKAMFQGGKILRDGYTLFTSRAFCKIQDEFYHCFIISRKGLIIPNTFYVKNKWLQTEVVQKYINFYPLIDKRDDGVWTSVSISDIDSYLNFHKILADRGTYAQL
ncbi:hypothetical protein MXB_5234 [Myxobolus squamalis]|nr:hypothetical protein MXB_5234 [Myxobolus squamalis]